MTFHRAHNGIFPLKSCLKTKLHWLLWHFGIHSALNIKNNQPFLAVEVTRFQGFFRVQLILYESLSDSQNLLFWFWVKMTVKLINCYICCGYVLQVCSIVLQEKGQKSFSEGLFPAQVFCMKRTAILQTATAHLRTDSAVHVLKRGLDYQPVLRHDEVMRSGMISTSLHTRYGVQR